MHSDNREICKDAKRKSRHHDSGVFAEGARKIKYYNEHKEEYDGNFRDRKIGERKGDH